MMNFLFQNYKYWFKKKILFLLMIHNFEIDFNNFIINDFVIDSEDANKIFTETIDSLKYSLKKPTIKINTMKLDDDKFKNMLTSFTFYEGELDENLKWKLVQKIDVEYCMILILNESILSKDNLDEWLEQCLKKLYSINPEGAICLNSGFGPGVYRLLGSYNESNQLIALRIEFIKENLV